ncbi:MAG: hypothetical protein JWO98_2565 [Frankiales bacterium]|nr:hypothetical protein [Frankiales bacterium]
MADTQIPPVDEAITRLTTFLESHKTATQDELRKGRICRVPSPDELVRHADRYGDVTAEVRASDIAAVLTELAKYRRCHCADGGPANYEGPQQDCPIHGGGQ